MNKKYQRTSEVKEHPLKRSYNIIIRIVVFSCILRASQAYSISRPNALYFKDHRDSSGLSGNTCEMDQTCRQGKNQNQRCNFLLL